MAGVRANRPVSLDQQNRTTMELAEGIAATARLSAARAPGGLVFAKKGADEWRQVRYRVDDLVGNADDASAIADLVRLFVQPESWADSKAAINIDGKTLEIRQQTANHFSILIFCERLRQARGLAPRSKYPTDLLEVTPRLAGLASKLDRRTTFTVFDWTPLVDLFHYWQQTSEMVLLVDWIRLADHDLRPMSTMAGSVNNATWAEALDACLTPLELAWVPVDGDTLQITTRDAADHTSWVEFYVGAEAESLRDRVENSCDASDLATFALQQDTSGNMVIVRGNRAVHTAAVR
jgi:hypothetical protein